MKKNRHILICSLLALSCAATQLNPIAESPVPELAASESVTEDATTEWLPTMTLIRTTLGEGSPVSCAELYDIVGDEYLHEHCDVELQLDGDVAVITIVLLDECGGDSCPILRWVVGDRIPPIALPQSDGMCGSSGNMCGSLGDGSVVVTPDQRSIIVNRIGLRDGQLGEWFIDLMRIDLATQRVEPFADCFEPSLSPDRQWIYCRDRAANVLRIAILGGPDLQMVERSGFNPEDVRWVPYAVIFPNPVQFTDTHLEYTVFLEKTRNEIVRKIDLSSP